MDLTGVYVPLVTPFDESGRIDQAQLGAAVEAMVAAGVHGIVACGTTGEGYALSLEERRAVTGRIKEVVAGTVPILGGVGGMSTDQALDHALLAKALELDGLMVAAPAYCLPTPTELATHVSAVVNAANLPTVLYDYPQRTGVSFDIETLDALAPMELIIGIKEASGDLDRVAEISSRYGDSIDIVCGADAAAPVFFDAGVRCWIGGIANLLPTAHLAMLDPTTRSEAYAAIVPILEFIESGRYNAKIKAGMAMLGLDVGIPRAPLAAVDAATSAELAELLDAAGTWAPALADG
ncbi:dihydrodipicolinate synthase family protein [bacterium]|nr:dihydrodipicolinate synthase family protein [bacterium]